MSTIVEIPKSHLQIISGIFKARTLKSFSPEVLSFLVGRPDNYVDSVESFKTECYPPQVLNKLSAILGDIDYGCPALEDILVDSVKVESETSFHGDFRFQNCILYKDNDEKEVFFSNGVNLTTDSWLDKSAPSYYNLVIITDTIALLTREGYFDVPRTALAIFTHIQNTFDLGITPDNLRRAFGLYYIYKEDSQKNRLVKIVKNGCFHYIKETE